MIGLLGIPILLNERNISYETYVSIHRNAYISTYIGAYISFEIILQENHKIIQEIESISRLDQLTIVSQ